MNTGVMFSSKTDQWATPRDIAATLVALHKIKTDVCADASNAVVPHFFSVEQDGLKQKWTGVCWMNPPYCKPEKVCKKGCTKASCMKRGWHRTIYLPGTGDWVAKAWDSALEGATIVALLPARTDVGWWHNFVEPIRVRTPNDVIFFRGRLRFGDSTNSAPFPSVLVVFRPEGVSESTP